MRASADTIAAIATAPGRAGVGVVRVSGTRARAVAEGLLGSCPPARQAVLRDFRDAYGEAIDRGLALWFAAPASYTGEDVLELQGHGGPVVLSAVLERCLALGARLARPGEFTERAWLNDRIDLAQAEAVADLIDAASLQAARGAMRSLSGEFSRRIDALAGEVLDLRVLVEATLDFPEEDGVDFLAASDARDRLARIQAVLSEVFSAARQGSALREGLVVVLAGEPNVGKSSLMNRLAGEEVAIVTDIPGTTRDAIRQSIVVDGLPVHLVDTAGLRESDDPVEREGIARTRAAIERADLVVSVRSAEAVGAESSSTERQVASLAAQARRITVVNKIDLTGEPAGETRHGDEWTIRLCAKTGEGITTLRRAFREVAGLGDAQEGLYLARARHLAALADAQRHVEAAGRSGLPADLIAEELRLAHDALGEIVGRMTPDALLGEIFGRFCIGK
jgi:tRNA modification GTPase